MTFLSSDFEYGEEELAEKSAVLHGNAGIVYDEAAGSNVLKLDNSTANGSYLEFLRGLFNGVQTLSIEMDVRSSQLYDDNSSLFQIANGTDPSLYFYFKYEPLGQGIRYSLNPGSEWKSSGYKEITDIGGDEYVHLRFEVEPTRHSVYLNEEDEPFLTYDTKGSLPMLGDGLYAFIGHSMFEIDKDYTGYIDNLTISGERLKSAGENAVTEYAEIFCADFENGTDELYTKGASPMGNTQIVFDEALNSNVLKLDNTSANGSYLEFRKGFFDGMQTLTLEMDIRSSQLCNDVNSSVFQLGNEDNPSLYFYFKYEPLGQGIRYSINPGSEWKSSGYKEITGIGGDEYVHLKFVIEEAKHTVYINESEFLSYATTGTLSMLGDGLYGYIGHSMFEWDKDYTGYIDNLTISGLRKVTEEAECEKLRTVVTEAEQASDEADLPEKSELTEAKNVIILIGDGMGQNQTQLSQWYFSGARTPYNMQSMPYVGLSKTYSANEAVTDSAAGGSAIATGIKTDNYHIASGYLISKNKNLTEYALEKGMAAGILTTTDITDATPAVFSSHAEDRLYRAEIASEQASSGIDIIMGSGGEHFPDLISGMEQESYSHVTTADELRALDKSAKVIGLCGVTGDLYQSESEPGTEPLLPEMVETAINMLDGRTENGFFLMAEGATIDHYCHSNHASGMIAQAKLFDLAVGKALEFARNDKNTRVIVTAAHETGGIGLLESADTEAEDSVLGKYEWTTGNHTSANVPIYAYGPGAEKLTGIHENTEIFDVALAAMGMERYTRPSVDEGNKGLILSLDFDNGDLSTEHGLAKAHGTLTYADGYNGKAVRFDGNTANYIELFSDGGGALLSDGNTFSVSYRSKTYISPSVNWMFYASPGEGVQTYLDETYLALLDTGSSVTAERFLHGRESGALANVSPGEWKHITMVADTNETRLYMNGALVSTEKSSFDVGDILSLFPCTYIGRANWVNGESANALVDDYKVFNYALSEAEIMAMYRGGEITALGADFDGSDIKFSASVSTDGESRIYAALYSGENELISVKSFNSGSIDGSFESLADDSYDVGLFVWKNNGLGPICSQRITVNKE